MPLIMTLAIIIAIVSVHSQWISPNLLLPRAERGQIIATWNGEIFLFSGIQNSQQLISFDIAKQNFTDYGISALSTLSTYHWFGEVNAQIGNVLFVPNSMDADGETVLIYAFNLASNNFFNPISSGMNGPTVPTRRRGCLAAKDGHNYLYMVGGSDGTDPMSNAQRYDIDNSEWDALNPMKQGRYFQSCIIDQVKNTNTSKFLQLFLTEKTEQ